MTAPLPSAARSPSRNPKTASTSSPREDRAETSPVLMDMLCSWVPGTTDIVRLRISAGRGTAERVIEVTSTRLGRMFGKDTVHDLYLKGRARVKVTAQQLALLT